MFSLERLCTALRDLLFPPSARQKRIAERGDAALLSLVSPRQLPSLRWITALVPYHDERAKDLVLAAKFSGDERAARLMGRVIAEYLLEALADETLLSDTGVPLLVPVPLGPKRLRERGYNQAARVARAAFESFPPGIVEYAPEALVRRETKPQTDLNRKARLENLYGAFSVSKRAVAGRSVILIDDVVTTGATLRDARRAVRKAGAGKVAAVAFAWAE
jgi:ComF family protein